MKTITRITFSALLSVFCSLSLAGEILLVRDQKVLLHFEPEETLRIHQQFSVTHPETGNKTGVIEILKKKNQKALGKIIQGYVRKGGITVPTSLIKESELEPVEGSDEKLSDNPEFDSAEESLLAEVLNSSPKKKNIPRSPSSMDDGSPSNPFYTPEEEPSLLRSYPGHWGFGLGVTPTVIKVSDSVSENTLKGNNFVVRIAYDKVLKNSLSLLMGATLLPIAGAQADNALGMAKVDANYIALDINARISLFNSPMQGPWVGAGFNYLKANSASSNVIDPQSMGSRTLLQLCAGINARMDHEYLTLRADFLMHPKSTSGETYVTINQYILSAIYFF